MNDKHRYITDVLEIALCHPFIELNLNTIQ